MNNTELHPLLRELFATMPPPGSVWPVRSQAAWLAALRACFDVVYGVDPADGGHAAP